MSIYAKDAEGTCSVWIRWSKDRRLQINNKSPHFL